MAIIIKTPLPITSLLFLGCDGKPWSDEHLTNVMNESIQEEDYEFAAACRDEIVRRNEAKLNPHD